MEVAYYMGDNERYPDWFADELYHSTFTDESRFTFWLPDDQRNPDYFEKQLVGDHSVFLRKPTGEIHMTSFDVFQDLYVEFTYDAFTNSGLAAYHEDVIEWVECFGGEVVETGYPDWFYEWITEAVNYQDGDETVVIDVQGKDVSILQHCAVLRNRFGELKVIDWSTFIKFYDIEPTVESLNAKYNS